MSLTEIIRDKLPSMWIEQGIEGCSEQDLNTLAGAQQVSCLPAVYRELMLFMGRKGVDRLLDANATVSQLGDELKRAVCAEFELDGLAYPTDIFIFSDHEGSTITFFRTKKCEDNPAVFANWESSCFRKMAENLSEYFLMMLEVFQNQQTARVWTERVKLAAYHYDPERDDFFRVETHSSL